MCAVDITDVSWTAARDLDLETWTLQGKRLGSLGRAVKWWIGDWLRYGNVKWGERYVRAARITGYDVQTLMNIVYVASHFEVDERRGDLSWSHHAEIASVAPDERGAWLDRAETDRLSVRCLREELRRHRRAADAVEPATVKPELVCPECGCRIADAALARARAAA